MNEMDLDQMADDIVEQDKPKIIDNRPNSSLLTFNPVIHSDSILIPYNNQDLNIKEIMLSRNEINKDAWLKMYKQTQIYKDKQHAYSQERYYSNPEVKKYHQEYQRRPEVKQRLKEAYERRKIKNNELQEGMNSL